MDEVRKKYNDSNQDYCYHCLKIKTAGVNKEKLFRKTNNIDNCTIQFRQ